MFAKFICFLYDSAMFEQNEIVLNGLLIRYYTMQRQERNDVPTLLFLHGWGSEGAVWRDVCEKLAHCGCALYALDLPGFGGSEAPSAPFSLRDYARIIEEFIIKLKLEPVVLVGHSFGGSVAIKFAALYPSRVSKLVLANSAGIRRSGVKKHAITLAAKLTKPFFAPRFMQNARKKIYAMLGAEDYLSTPPELRDTFRAVIGEDITPILPSVKHETLIIWGYSDRATPIRDAHIFARLMPNARLVILQDAGHYSFLDKQDEWVEEVTAWVRQKIFGSSPAHCQPDVAKNILPNHSTSQ